MTKYSPLEQHLRDLRTNKTTLSFDEIERILGTPLPPSSRTWEAHWRGSTPDRPGGAVAAAGWKVERIDWLAGTVTLVGGRR